MRKALGVLLEGLIVAGLFGIILWFLVIRNALPGEEKGAALFFGLILLVAFIVAGLESRRR